MSTCEVETELLLHLHQHLWQVRALGDVLDPRVAHETQQVQDQVRRLAEPIVRL
jgi:hypothetical protein